MKTIILVTALLVTGCVPLSTSQRDECQRLGGASCSSMLFIYERF